MCQIAINGNEFLGLLPDQPHANLALEHFQYFPVDVSLKKPYVLLETFYCLRATLGRSEKKGSFFWRVICPRRGKSRDDVIHLQQTPASQPRQNAENANLVHENLDTGVQSLCDRIIEQVLKPFLFSEDRIQKIGQINVRGLSQQY